MFSPFLAVASKILNGYLAAGLISTVWMIFCPPLPASLTVLGLMAANSSTLPPRTSVIVGCAGSLLVTMIFFARVFPASFFVSSAMLTLPSPPAGISLVKEAVVHPQPVSTF
jgi:hypothetical protein